MKTQVNKWIRWGAAGVFGLMLTLNVMVGLEFEKDKVMPSLTLVELGNQANAQSESGNTGEYYMEYDECDNYYNGCNYIVVKCRYSGRSKCYTSSQISCSEACSW